MSLTKNDLMTYGAIGFALFAAFVVTRKPASGPVSSQPGQQQRDAAMLTWNQQQLSQWEHLSDQLATELPHTTPLIEGSQ